MINKIELLQPDVEEIIIYQGPNELEAIQHFENLQTEYATNKYITYNGKMYEALRLILDPQITSTLLKKVVVSFIGRQI